MVKLASNDILAILRKFDLAREEHVPRHVEHVVFSHPSETNTLVAFRFQKHDFYVLVDQDAEDDPDYILDQIHSDRLDAGGELIANPRDSTMTYGMPYKGKDVYLFEVMTAKKRLDVVLAERYPALSRSTWQKHVKAGHVSVNGVAVTSPKYDVLPGDDIQAAVPDAPDFADQTLPVLYQDENVVVINKPAGVLTHSKGALNDEFTVAEFLRPLTTFGTGTNRPGIIHRLDRDTSGVIIGARTPEAAAYLARQFSQRTVKKTYHAVTDGIPEHTEALVDLPIGRNPSSPSTFRVDPKGKAAQTDYKVLAASGAHALIELKPKTGRTHQLRVHMQYMRTPIHGDRVYGVPADRLYLHAHSLEITLPGGERRTFSAPTPPEFARLAEERA